MIPSESEAEQQVPAQDNSSLSVAHLACSLSVKAGSRLHNAGSKLEIIGITLAAPEAAEA